MVLWTKKAMKFERAVIQAYGSLALKDNFEVRG